MATKPVPSTPAAPTAAPWYAGILRLLKSGKAWVTLLASLGAVAMNVHGSVGGDKTLNFVEIVVGLYLIAHAAEDAALKLRGKDPAAVAGALASVIPQILPVLEDMLRKSAPSLSELEHALGMDKEDPSAVKNVAPDPKKETPADTTTKS